jgi:replication-associated recombination protein RarA
MQSNQPKENKKEEQKFDSALRPRSFSEFVGQEKIRKKSWENNFSQHSGFGNGGWNESHFWSGN